MDVKQAENEAAAASYCSEVVDQIFGNSDLAYLILAACDAATMLQLGVVNRAMHSILQSYMQTAFSINHLLSRFFPDPDMFRIIQGKTATLICGTQVLQFFDRSDSVDSDLELLLFPGRKREIAQFLAESGYEFVPRRNQTHGRITMIYAHSHTPMIGSGKASFVCHWKILFSGVI
jgi:hypothetical protein